MATYRNPEAEDESYQLNEFMHDDYLGHSNDFDGQHLVTSGQFFEHGTNSETGDRTKLESFTIDQMMLENQSGRIPPTPDSSLLNPKQPSEYRSSFGDHHQNHQLVTLGGNDFYVEDRRYMGGGSDELSMAVGNDNLFTPLISPAVLPIGDNSSYSTPNLSSATGTRPSFRVSSEYFSPLTSPALEAHTHPFLKRQQESFSFSAEERRPSLESSGTPSSSSGRVVKASPLTRPSSSRNRTPKVLALNPSSSSRPPTNGADGCDYSPATFPSNDDSHSISPELLPESLLEPPTIHMPESSGGVFGKFSLSEMQKNVDEEHKPKIPGHILNETPGRISPATPSILMNIRNTNSEKQPTTEAASSYSAMSVQDALDAAQATRMKLDSNNNSTSSTETEQQKSKSKKSSPALPPQRGPNNRLRRTPRLKPQSGPSRASSNGSACNTNGDVRPSPQIKPLLRSRSIETNVQSTKSNYQHIVEGSSAEAGLDFPANINENIRSRRTNHKVAEQERRNRINVALTELAGLLPPCEENIMSKATTVEMAIRFIRQQQAKIEELEAHIRGIEGSDNGSS